VAALPPAPLDIPDARLVLLGCDHGGGRRGVGGGAGVLQLLRTEAYEWVRALAGEQSDIASILRNGMGG